MMQHSILNPNLLTKRKHLKYVSAILILSCIGLVLFIFFQSFTPQKKYKDFDKINYSKIMSASKLSFIEFKDAKKSFSFEAENIEISKKKIGFFRIGFFNVAKINGLKLNVYLNPGGAKPIEDSIDLKQYLLNNESIKIINLNNIKGLEIEDVEINFFQDKHLVSSIKSDQASMAFYRKELIFSGNVSICSENEKILKSDSIRWVNGQKQFSTIESYQINTGADMIEGKGISCDYKLDNIHFFSESKKHVLPKN